MIESRNPIKIFKQNYSFKQKYFLFKDVSTLRKIKWTINSYLSNKIQNFQWPKNQCAFVKDVRVTVKKNHILNSGKPAPNKDNTNWQCFCLFQMFLSFSELIHLILINPFHANDLFWYPLKTSDKDHCKEL